VRQPDMPASHASTPQGQRVAHRQRTRRRRALVWVSASLSVILVAGLAFAAAVYFQVVGNISENVVARPGVTAEPLVIPNWDGPVNLVIMGSDSRDGLTSGDYGSQDTSGIRSDVLMVLHVSADHKDATLVSFPRDTMMPIPECTSPDGEVIEAQDEAQINGALAYGPYCTMDAISAFTGLPIDHFVVVDFDGVIDMTNAIGGVDVCVEHDVEDSDSGLYLTAGAHNLQGAEALAFVRTRGGFADGSDLGRISAQQTFLAALARKVKSAGTLANPVALFNLADAASSSVTVDPALGAVPSMVGLAGTLSSVDLDRMVLLQLPVEDYWADSNRVQPISDQAEQIFAALRADQPLSFGDVVAEAAPEGEQPDDGTAAPTEPAPVPVPDDAKGQRAIDATCAK